MRRRTPEEVQAGFEALVATAKSVFALAGAGNLKACPELAMSMQGDIGKLGMGAVMGSRNGPALIQAVDFVQRSLNQNDPAAVQVHANRVVLQASRTLYHNGKSIQSAADSMDSTGYEVSHLTEKAADSEWKSLVVEVPEYWTAVRPKLNMDKGVVNKTDELVAALAKAGSLVEARRLAEGLYDKTHAVLQTLTPGLAGTDRSSDKADR